VALQRIQWRRGTAAEWTAANPVLADGEPGWERDTQKIKVGNGTSTWSALPYFTSGGGTGGGTVPQSEATLLDQWINGVSLANPATAPTRTLLFNGTNGGTPDAFGRAAVNSAEWNYDQGAGPLGSSGNRWGNWEAETYTPRLKNVYVQNGLLNIVAWREEDYVNPYDGFQADFTSGRIHTQGKVSMPVGSYVEARVKASGTPANWSAWWFMGDNYTGSNWPFCGEADAFEGLGANKWVAGHALHMQDAAGGINTNKGIFWDYSPDMIQHLSVPIDRWHYYGMYHSATEIRFYIDRVQTFRYTSTEASATGRVWPFNQGMFLLINLAVGGLASGVDGGESVAGAMPSWVQVEPIKIWNGGVPF
jgi:beta-glucanase (GH16 family)